MYRIEYSSAVGGNPDWQWVGGSTLKRGIVGEDEYDTPAQAAQAISDRIKILAASQTDDPSWRSRYRVVSTTPMPVAGLPTDDKERKALPIFRGPLMYFPDALLEVARLCKIGNDQHNPGQPMHWARGKSTEQLDTAVRHMMDHGLGVTKDSDGVYHMAKAAWRCLAELQLAIEKERAK